MTSSILNGKKILAVDEEPDILTILEEKIINCCPNCLVYKATTYEATIKKIHSEFYDLVILDIMNACGFDLLEAASNKGLNTAVLTTQSLNSDILKHAFNSGALAYLPREKIGDIAIFLENDLGYIFLPKWKNFTEKLYKISL